MTKNPEARTERVIVGFTREVSMAIFVRALVLDVVADDRTAHQETAAE